MPVEEAVIVGAGPAGLAAANQLELYGIYAVVLEANEPGGLLLNAGSVWNYPGVPQGTTGFELVKRFPVPKRLRKMSVSSVERSPQSMYRISWADGFFKTQTVIVASGTVPVQIPLAGVDPAKVFHEVRKIPTGIYNSVAIIGGGDAALDYALALSTGMEVNIYARSGFCGAVPHLLKEVSAAGSIKLFANQSVFAGFKEDIVLIACGRRPNLGFISEDLLCSPPEDNSFLLCGDCINGIYRQASIAAGDGVRAAMKTAECLKKRKKTR